MNDDTFQKGSFVPDDMYGARGRGAMQHDTRRYIMDAIATTRAIHTTGMYNPTPYRPPVVQATNSGFVSSAETLKFTRGHMYPDGSQIRQMPPSSAFTRVSDYDPAHNPHWYRQSQLDPQVGTDTAQDAPLLVQALKPRDEDESTPVKMDILSSEDAARAFYSARRGAKLEALRKDHNKGVIPNKLAWTQDRDVITDSNAASQP